MENKGSALYLCPGCGAFVSENASKCPNCGEVLDSAPDEDLPISPNEPVDSETQAEIDSLELLTAEPEVESEPVTLFLCSACGAFTGGDASTCPNCGASMRDDEETEPQKLPGAPDSDLLDMLVVADEPSSGAEHLIDDLKKIESEEDVQNFIESIPFKDPDILLEMGPGSDIGPDELDISEDLLKELELTSDSPEEVSVASTT